MKYHFGFNQLLNLSLVDTVQVISRSKKEVKISTNNREVKLHNKSPRDTNRKARSSSSRTPTNGVILSFTNINETKVKTRLTTDVSQRFILRFILIID